MSAGKIVRGYVLENVRGREMIRLSAGRMSWKVSAWNRLSAVRLVCPGKNSTWGPRICASSSRTTANSRFTWANSSETVISTKDSPAMDLFVGMCQTCHDIMRSRHRTGQRRVVQGIAGLWRIVQGSGDGVVDMG